ncbi:2-hydroxymuconate tautomerase [Agrilactobacillus yilanensis]|uniref:Tautomerase n=1 Tax=Agrilactobacillus yilanensis TaxID=2485997 RepID=A0ABW4J862_9LACO|nr:2-hydroxymuconate tautomerase [Agrilactobacillus yilanensis]
MPLVHIELLEGRSKAQLKDLVKDVTEVIAKDTGAPAEHIHVVLSEMAHDHYAVGGVLHSDEK